MVYYIHIRKQKWKANSYYLSFTITFLEYLINFFIYYLCKYCLRPLVCLFSLYVVIVCWLLLAFFNVLSYLNNLKHLPNNENLCSILGVLLILTKTLANWLTCSQPLQFDSQSRSSS